MKALDAVPITVQQQQVSDTLTVAATQLHEGILQRAVHGLKYENVLDVGQPLGKRLAEALTQLNWQIDTIVSVPLHTTRLTQRGYNQANVIGDVAAHLHQIPFKPESVLRNRATQSQVTLNREERLTNMEGAFIAVPEHVTNKTILVIDDVFTTGATLVGVAQALTEAGATIVYGLTVTTASPLSTTKD